MPGDVMNPIILVLMTTVVYMWQGIFFLLQFRTRISHLPPNSTPLRMLPEQSADPDSSSDIEIDGEPVLVEEDGALSEDENLFEQALRHTDRKTPMLNRQDLYNEEKYAPFVCRPSAVALISFPICAHDAISCSSCYNTPAYTVFDLAIHSLCIC